MSVVSKLQNMHKFVQNSVVWKDIFFRDFFNIPFNTIVKVTLKAIFSFSVMNHWTKSHLHKPVSLWKTELRIFNSKDNKIRAHFGPQGLQNVWNKPLSNCKSSYEVCSNEWELEFVLLSTCMFWTCKRKCKLKAKKCVEKLILKV